MLQPRQNPPANLMVLRILWGAMLMSQVVYYVVLEQMKMMGSSQDVSMLRQVLPGIAGIFFLLGFYFPTILWKKGGQKWKGQDLNQISEPDLVAVFITPFIIRLALFEAIAVIGFALSFLTADTSLYPMFFAVSAFCFLLNFPSKDKMITALKA